MKTITSQDKGKRFFLDNKREVEVELTDLLPDNEGYVKVKFSDGRLVNVEEHRLTEITDLPFNVGELSPEELADLEYPTKVSKITMEMYDAEKGEISTKWLEGKEAEQWNNWMRELCYRAEKLGINPKWLALRWKTLHKDS